MKEISPILHALGFLESEISTYLASLQHGPSTVLELTKLTSLSRQATYVVIDSLTERGLMSSVLRGKKKYYVAEEPEKLLSYAQRKETELKDQVHDLEGLVPELKLKAGGEKPVVKLFEGKEGFLSMITDMQMAKCLEMNEIFDLDAKRAFIPSGSLHTMLKGLRKIGTHVRGLYTVQPAGISIQPEWYLLPEKMRGFKAGLVIYGNKLACFSFEGKLNSVVIESESIVRAVKTLFDLAFEHQKDSQKKMMGSSESKTDDNRGTV